MSLGCHDRVPQPGQPEPQKFILVYPAFHIIAIQVLTLKQKILTEKKMILSFVTISTAAELLLQKVIVPLKQVIVMWTNPV